MPVFAFFYSLACSNQRRLLRTITIQLVMTYAQTVLVSLTARKIVNIFGASELLSGHMCIGEILSKAKVEVLVVFLRTAQYGQRNKEGGCS